MRGLDDRGQRKPHMCPSTPGRPPQDDESNQGHNRAAPASQAAPTRFPLRFHVSYRLPGAGVNPISTAFLNLMNEASMSDSSAGSGTTAWWRCGARLMK